MVIVGAEHLRSQRLAEAAAAGNATEALLSEKRSIDDGYQPRLVDVFTVEDALEIFVSLVDVYSHVVPFFLTNSRLGQIVCKDTKVFTIKQKRTKKYFDYSMW